MKIKKYLLNILTIIFMLFSLSYVNVCQYYRSTNFISNNQLKNKYAISNQSELWINVDKIDDGAVYFIRNAYNENLVWDIPNSNYSNNTKPILYNSNGWGNQRFIVHEQAKYNNKMYYTISPLNRPDANLKINENGELKINQDNNSSLTEFLSNKFIIEKSTYGFKILTGVSNFEKYLVPKNENVTINNILAHKNINDIESNKNCQWLFCKTDSLGNDLKNKIYINGISTKDFNLIPPSTGEFVIETEKFGSNNYDTFLELYDKNNNRLAYNDDISGSENRFSRIIYKFDTIDDFKVRVRGYTSNDVGYVYLTIRPKNPLYFVGVYDFDKNNNDRPGSLENTKKYLSNYYVEVQANRGKSAILETASNGKKKINSDYFVFSGHGYSNASGVEFYNGVSTEGFMWNEIPSLVNTKIAIWMSCHGARNYFKYGSSGELTSMAFQSINKGADYSLAYVGEIYDTTQRAFPENFFEAISNGMNIPDAIDKATEWVINDNWWWWTFFGQYNDDFNNPILYKKGDLIKDSCGNGNYSSSTAQLNKMTLNNNNIYVDNTITQSENCVTMQNIDDLVNSFDFSYNPKYIFKTNYCGEIYMLGFDCDLDTGKVVYYDLTFNREITSYEFEKKMGNPSNGIVSYLKQSN